jgi:hypothetical protein
LKGRVASRETIDSRHLKGKKHRKKGKQGKDGECKKGKDLDNFEQWRGEVGYWIGEYTLLQGDGTPNESSTWPYPYDSYMGFISGNIKGGSYRQRNIFLYPPQTANVALNLTVQSSGVVLVEPMATRLSLRPIKVDAARMDASQGPFSLVPSQLILLRNWLAPTMPCRIKSFLEVK